MYHPNRSHVLGNSKRVPSTLYMHYSHTIEKRVEKRHLLVGFSPVMVFQRKYFCYFVDVVRLYFTVLYFQHFIYFMHKQKINN
jgi:hypothetical protein